MQFLKSRAPKKNVTSRVVRNVCAIAVGVSLALAALGTPANATTFTSITCADFENWTFTPALDTTTPGTGRTWGGSYSELCAKATVTTSPIGESVVETTPSGGINSALFGNCVLALAARGSQAIMVGGSVAVVYVVLTGSRVALGQVIVAAPNAVCNETSASAVGGASQDEQLA